MKLGTLRSDQRDGRLVVVSRDLARAVIAGDFAPTLQAALDAWDDVAPQLEARAADLAAGRAEDAFALEPSRLAAPLPRAFAWVDASAYLSHMERARGLRGAPLPADYREVPRLYDGVSHTFLASHDPLPCPPGDVGLDIEAEVAVILGDLPWASGTPDAARAIRLVTLVNDTTLRTVFAAEMAAGRNNYHGKPPCSMAPVAVTPDELGAAWADGRINLPLHCHVNGALLGKLNAGLDMAFDFPTLIAHATRTRPLAAGTVLGAGTVSNCDPAAGAACIAERRMIEALETGQPLMRYLEPGDEVRIEMLDEQGASMFGAIRHRIVAATREG